MTRITETFAALRARREVALIPYITAGDPDLEATFDIVQELARQGADIIELGVPFSDPMADGPTHQRAAERALQSGTSLARILDMVQYLRQSVSVPIILFSYYNPIFRYGGERFAQDARVRPELMGCCVLISRLKKPMSSNARRISKILILSFCLPRQAHSRGREPF